MTARQVYEGVLIELNKVQAPSLLLEDFNLTKPYISTLIKSTTYMTLINKLLMM